MKNLLLITVLSVSLAFLGCQPKTDVCCEFANGCAMQKSDEDCEKAGGTVKAGTCTAIIDEEEPSVTYVCQ